MAPYLPPGLPQPRPDRMGLDEPYWAGLAGHRLVVQRCGRCGALRPPAEWLCDRCRSRDYDWVEVAGRGSVYSWTRVWHPTHPALADAGPYLVVVVALVEHPELRFLGNLLGDPLAPVDIDDPVEAVFEDGGEGRATLLQWRRR